MPRAGGQGALEGDPDPQYYRATKNAMGTLIAFYGEIGDEKMRRLMELERDRLERITTTEEESP